MSTLGWWMVLSPMAVMLLGVRVVRYRGRYRGRRRNDAGVEIFQVQHPQPRTHVVRVSAIQSTGRVTIDPPINVKQGDRVLVVFPDWEGRARTQDFDIRKDMTLTSVLTGDTRPSWRS